MDNKFIYVFSSESKDLLLEHGFIPAKFDEQNNIFAFHNQETMNFAFGSVSYVLTDIITF